MRDASVLVSDAEADGVTMPQMDELRKAIADAKAWLELGRKSLQARATRGVATRATLEEVWELYNAGQALPLTLPEVSAVPLAFHWPSTGLPLAFHWPSTGLPLTVHGLPCRR